MRLKILIAWVGLALALVGPAPAQTPFRPVAIVNDAVITGFDLAQRTQILAALGYPTANPGQLQSEALDQLIEDKLKLQAGKAIGITPTPEMIASGIEQYASQTRTTPEQFRASLTTRGVTEQALDDMVGAQMVWLQRRAHPLQRTRRARRGRDRCRAGAAFGPGGGGIPDLRDRAASAGRRADRGRDARPGAASRAVAEPGRRLQGGGRPLFRGTERRARRRGRLGDVGQHAARAAAGARLAAGRPGFAPHPGFRRHFHPQAGRQATDNRAGRRRGRDARGRPQLS